MFRLNFIKSTQNVSRVLDLMVAKQPSSCQLCSKLMFMPQSIRFLSSAPSLYAAPTNRFGRISPSQQQRQQQPPPQQQQQQQQHQKQRPSRSLSKIDRDGNRLVFVDGKWRSANEWLRIITEHARNAELEQMEQAFDEMTKVYKVAPGVQVFNCMITALGKKKRATLAFKYYQQMKKRNLTPTEYTLTSLFNACTDNIGGQKDLALLLYHEVIERTLPVSTFTCNSALQVAFRTRDPDWAVDIFELMLERCKKGEDCRPDSYTYTFLLKAFEDTGDVEHATQLLEVAASAHVRIDSYVLGAFVNICTSSLRQPRNKGRRNSTDLEQGVHRSDNNHHHHTKNNNNDDNNNNNHNHNNNINNTQDNDDGRRHSTSDSFGNQHRDHRQDFSTTSNNNPTSTSITNNKNINNNNDNNNDVKQGENPELDVCAVVLRKLKILEEHDHSITPQFASVLLKFSWYYLRFTPNVAHDDVIEMLGLVLDMAEHSDISFTTETMNRYLRVLSELGDFDAIQDCLLLMNETDVDVDWMTIRAVLSGHYKSVETIRQALHTMKMLHNDGHPVDDRNVVEFLSRVTRASDKISRKVAKRGVKNYHVKETVVIPWNLVTRVLEWRRIDVNTIETSRKGWTFQRRPQELLLELKHLSTTMDIFMRDHSYIVADNTKEQHDNNTNEQHADKQQHADNKQQPRPHWYNAAHEAHSSISKAIVELENVAPVSPTHATS